ncbi:ribonuclease P protein component [Gracilibacillus boraciitolerans JCM 21714]|uniref:Ribonuclease P protein component n=1 Tax=Gracilibacillus boraciitolerans JCM 21714 TaxID=1298598 RepID=W4VKZ8_9BACI|nr:ribonuclease P protein component [Gracilibacillus boraciitolerans]GAE93836.1 ribonuclease P protein component [Gracilibacillus boraciitolerans JCM 21714]
MKKAWRIKKNGEFQEVFKQGDSFANRQLVIFYLHRDQQQHYRVGLSVSKKIGNAVVRNQVKRYIRQAFLEMDLNIKNNYDIIIIARKPVKEMDFHGIKKSVNHLLYKTNLLLKNK